MRSIFLAVPAKSNPALEQWADGTDKLTAKLQGMGLMLSDQTVKADAISVQAMKDKGLNPDKDRKLRSDFIRRILVFLHDLRKAGEVEKVGHGRGVVWRLKP